MCFAYLNETSNKVSTLDRSLMKAVKALTSADKGLYICNASKLYSNQDINATFSVNLTGNRKPIISTLDISYNVGVGIFEQINLTTVTNNSYYIARSDGYLNVQLHCIGAGGAGNWTDPNGNSDIAEHSAFHIYTDTEFGTTVLEHTAQLENVNSSESGSGSDMLYPYIFTEGYYTCTAEDENGNYQSITVGLFNNETGKYIMTTLYL